MKDDLVYLRHIVGAIKDIEAYTVGGREVFFSTNKSNLSNGNCSLILVTSFLVQTSFVNSSHYLL